MNGNVGGGGPVSSPSDINCNSNSTTMVSDLSSPESQTQSQPFTPRASRTPKKAATFGKRSNSMRRNPKAVVAKQGWLYKQASSGVKQWNKRWFVLTDRCLFYYKDEKEEGVLGSLPLLSFRIGEVQVLDNISRKHAFKVWYEEEEEGEIKGTVVFCLQAEHAGTRTYYFSAETAEEQEEWIDAMNEAAHVQIQPAQRTTNSEATTPTAELHGNTLVTKGPEPHTQTHTHIEDNGQTTDLLDPERGSREPAHHKVNGVAMETPPPSTSHSEKEGRMGGERGERGERGVLGPGGAPHHQPNGWGPYGPPNHGNGPPQGNGRPPLVPPEGGMREGREVRDQPENVVLRRGFVPRTNPERQAQRKSSMTQLQQWVNQRRVIAVQEDLNSPSHYYTVNRGVPADYYSVYSSVGGGPGYVEEYPIYPPGVRPDSICSVSAVGYDRVGPPRWTNDEKRRSLRDGPLYGPPLPRDPYGPKPSPAYYDQMDAAQTAMRRLSIQPRSRSVPRSPSSSMGGPYSPSPHSFASPICSPSARFDRGPGRLREDVIYADPSVYGLRRSLSSPKYDYPGDRRSLSQGMYHYNYPASPSLHSKMEDILDLQLQRNLEYLDQQVPPFHDPYRELHPTLKLNEIETSKLLGRLCEQNRFLKDQEAVVHRLRMDKDSLEGALVATHQEMELYRGQPLVADKLQLKKETLQNQLINIRGELSQASSALTTTRMEFEALEDEVNAIHGDLWEQLNAGGQSEMVHRHIQKEFWRVQEVWEGLHKSNLSRGTDTAKHRVASGASGSFSTNSPASPLSSVSLTSPLSPFSPVPGSQVSPTKQLGPEQKYGYRQDVSPGERTNSNEAQELDQDRQANMNKVGIVPPRTKSPMEDQGHSYDHGITRRNGKVPNGISRERPKSAVFPAEVKSKMSIEEQNERIRRNQSSSVRDKRRSLNLGSQAGNNYRVVKRRLTAHEVDIKDLEAAVRGGGLQESPREEIARLRRLQMEPDYYDLDISKELCAPNKVLIPERYLDVEPNTPLSPEEQKEKQKKVERIKTLIAKSNLQNVVPLLDGPTEGGGPHHHGNPEQKIQEQEKRIEISCALAAEASRRSRLLSAQCAPSPPPPRPTWPLPRPAPTSPTPFTS
ncbi:pleckstrin homology domain-containing family A member 6 isoform X4 [Salvelinus namaycush]|nr:pleckstrin homology domain-containing family A member 6 isoform X4 [Salvelinus namaycush]XP_038869019.1 pleckstrin homology domain-containing family A member 6 isoform X4 [Salvelinus namaycush]XP_038869027.1 pleckstrin homology domain-containing family A member 6 isoform X4 [Salvelinus namaycush]XP_038869054.1 pleckstrin homology domain-containing family A member 6 isoform X4 [Salvelinus namaycush]